jgi:hypothetical protein
MSKQQLSDPSVRKYMVTKNKDVLGTYTTLRMAVASAVRWQGTVYSVERVEDCLVHLAQHKTFEVV